MSNIFQLYDWYAFDEKKGYDEDSDASSESEDESKIMQKYTIYLFGVDQKGANHTIKVLNFEPYFWIQLPSKWYIKWTDILLEFLQNSLYRNMRDEMIVDNNTKQIFKKFVFRDYQWNRRRHFIKLSFKSESALRNIYSKLSKNITIPGTDLKDYKFKIFEKNIQPILRFIHIKDIQPTGWIEIKSAKKISKISGDSHYSNWEVDWNNIEKVKDQKLSESIGAINIASFDIEADSSHGDFPLAKKTYSKLTSEIYDEYMKCKKNKIQVTPSKIKVWLKTAFRNYICEEENKKLSDDLKSSFQDIQLKNEYKVENALFDKIGTALFRELAKLKSKKNKEVTESICQLLDSLLPSIRGDKIIQIGTVSYNYGYEKTSVKRHIVTLGGCEKLDGIEVVSCNSVEELIKEWVNYLSILQPNIITGYNIFGFDFKFVWECAEEFNCSHYLENIGPIKSLKTKLEEKNLSSSALGQNILYYFNSPGIVMIDLMKVIQKDHNLSSYKLDNVSVDFIHGKISQIELNEEMKQINLYTNNTFSLNPGQFIIVYEESIIGKEVIVEKSKIESIQENKLVVLKFDRETFKTLKSINSKPKSHFWAVGKDNVSPKDIFELQRGNDHDRSIVAKYCVQDCELCLNLMQKLEIVANNIGMSNVCLVPLAYLFMRGQMIKTLSLVSSECMKENYIIPELPRPDDDIKESYEGAEVLEPTPAIHLEDPISVLDYGSLYPSSMIGTNISHDTIITDKNFLGEEGGKILKEMGLEYEDVSYDNYVNILSGKTWKKIINSENPVVTCRYIQPPKIEGKIDDSKRGILPRILMKLLKARKDTRAMIKNEKDPFRRSVLDGLQLAYKVTANSLYGGVGAAVSALYYKDIAASTTAVGRKHLHLAKSYVNEVYPQADVIYGDTDSIFVNFKPKGDTNEKLSAKDAIQSSIDMALNVEKGIQKLLQYPHKLEYEKTFYPFILLRKKGYIGNKYEFDLDHYKQTSMGVVTKRRDNAPIVKYIYDGIIRKIINDRDIEGSIQFLKDTIQRILKGEFTMQYFIITKCLRSEYANPEQIVHKVLADRMGERDSGNKPQSNDRIPYVYIKTKKKANLQGERVEHPDYIKEHGLEIDYPFYITNQIQKPVCQVYALSLESLRTHGYKLPTDHFDKLEKKLKNENKKNIREKIMEKKMDAVYDVLFKKIVQVEEGKKYGQRLISDLFKKKE